MQYRIKEPGEDGSLPLGNWGCFLLIICIVLFALSCAVGALGYAAGWFREAAAVAQEQLGPRALLKKYEWFKDAHAQLDAKMANIRVYNQRFAEQDKRAAGKELSRTSEEQRNIWLGEKAGVVASYNDLAAEYNAQMSKINYRFTNLGDLPQGATEPLPRNVISYQDGQ